MTYRYHDLANIVSIQSLFLNTMKVEEEDTSQSTLILPRNYLKKRTRLDMKNFNSAIEL